LETEQVSSRAGEFGCFGEGPSRQALHSLTCGQLLS